MREQRRNPRDVSRRHRDRKGLAIPPFDLFRIVNGNPIWVRTAVTLEEARLKIQELQKQEPGEYLIISIQTGHKESVKNAKTASTI
jgi:hypothetical protein